MMNTYKDRGEGIAEFLKILTKEDKPVKVPLMAEKVRNLSDFIFTLTLSLPSNVAHIQQKLV